MIEDNPNAGITEACATYIALTIASIEKSTGGPLTPLELRVVSAVAKSGFITGMLFCCDILIINEGNETLSPQFIAKHATQCAAEMGLEQINTRSHE